jgi:hypothetical protein
VLSIRIASIGGVGTQSGYDVRMLTTGVMGIFGTASAEFIPRGIPLVLPVVAGLLQAVGVFGINQALAGPFTAICISIFGSNSVVVLLLTAAVQEEFPPVSVMSGMVITVVGCTMISLAADDGKPEEAASPMKKRNSMQQAGLYVSPVTSPSTKIDPKKQPLLA